jgi:hypothetical protein
VHPERLWGRLAHALSSAMALRIFSLEQIPESWNSLDRHRSSASRKDRAFADGFANGQFRP